MGVLIPPAPLDKGGLIPPAPLDKGGLIPPAPRFDCRVDSWINPTLIRGKPKTRLQFNYNQLLISQPHIVHLFKKIEKEKKGKKEKKRKRVTKSSQHRTPPENRRTWWSSRGGRRRSGKQNGSYLDGCTKNRPAELYLPDFAVFCSFLAEDYHH